MDIIIILLIFGFLFGFVVLYSFWCLNIGSCRYKIKCKLFKQYMISWDIHSGKEITDFKEQYHGEIDYIIWSTWGMGCFEIRVVFTSKADFVKFKLSQ